MIFFQSKGLDPRLLKEVGDLVVYGDYYIYLSHLDELRSQIKLAAINEQQKRYLLATILNI
ncbi:hypothetical protein [Nostoc sp. DedVER01b]|uniref:hypothetical protein n=1 Tax=Nostoc sp. DedVER01b TaxID=3075404 RepID=UPI002AD74242|nr:hypothetical protein [Nostoc sp. DedVER01b]